MPHHDETDNPQIPSRALEASILLARVLMGAYFMLAGIAKARGELTVEFGNFYKNAYQPMQPWFVPDFIGIPMGYTLPWIEIVLGLLLIVGLLTRISAALIALLIVSFTIALIMAKGGISGGAPGPFHPNFIMIAVCVIVIAMGPGRWSIDALTHKNKDDD